MQSQTDQTVENADDHDAWFSPSRKVFTVVTSGVLALAAYAIGLISNAPASLLSKRLPDHIGAVTATGTVLNGAMTSRDGVFVNWSLSPLRSLIAARAVGIWRLSGPAALLEGEARLSGNTVSLRSVSGRLSPAALSGLDLPIAPDCDFNLRVDLVQLDILADTFRGEGEVETGVISCSDLSIDPVILRIQPTEEGSVFVVTRADDNTDTVLASGTVGPDRKFLATITAKGVETFSGQNDSGIIDVEYKW